MPKEHYNKRSVVQCVVFPAKNNIMLSFKSMAQSNFSKDILRILFLNVYSVRSVLFLCMYNIICPNAKIGFYDLFTKTANNLFILPGVAQRLSKVFSG